MVYVDIGGRYMGYYSDCSRQRVCGDPTPEQLRFMETQIRIVEEVMKAAKPGAVIADLAEIGIQIARDAGYEQYIFPGAWHRLRHPRPAFVRARQPEEARRRHGALLRADACQKGVRHRRWEDIWWVTSDRVERLNECPFRWW